MCGIAGVLEWGGRPIDRALVARMTDTLAHRGPDDAGIHISGPVGLGHRRLSILDLSRAGHQPMGSADGSLWLSHNGEIYNHRELRAELEGRGHRFRSGTDTEVILAGYQEWDVDCLTHFNGMFAFALWDAPRRRLWLVRDRLGVKPLFYAQSTEALLFGSEAKALLQDPRLSRELDHRALAYFLALNWTPAPHTLFAGVRQLLPGHYILATADGTFRDVEYWDLRYSRPEPDRGEAAHREELAARLTEAVRLRLVSDVPFGAFLSGGLDSSVVARLMANELEQPVRTFTIGFGEPAFDEVDNAREVAAAIGTEHHERTVTADLATVLPRLVWHAEEPTADSSMVAVYYLAAEARRVVKMVLTGDGADELLGGYSTYPARRLVPLWQFLPRWLRDGMIPALAGLIPHGDGKVGWDEKLRRFVASASLPPEDAHAVWRQIFAPDERRRLLAPIAGTPGTDADPVDLYREWFARTSASDALERLLYVDLRLYLPNDMLVKVDRMTMAHGLEARTPFLDYRLVEAMARVPSRYKIGRTFAGKQLLRQVAHGLLPARVAHRRKAGFNVPLARWLRGGLREFAGDQLAAARVRRMGLLDANVVSGVWNEHVSGRADRSHQIWCLLTLVLWWETFMAGDRSRSALAEAAL